VRELDSGGAVAAERGPQSEDHPSGLEEANLVVGLLGPAPAERLVKGAGPRELGDVENPADHPAPRPGARGDRGGGVSDAPGMAPGEQDQVIRVHAGGQACGEGKPEALVGPGDQGDTRV